MKLRTVIAGLVCAGFIVFGSVRFFENNVGYADVAEARRSDRKVQLMGKWDRTRGSRFDPGAGTFTFHLVDARGEVCKVVLDGPAPNNFELATSVVARGRYSSAEGCFRATGLLTKCPSKYETGGDLGGVRPGRPSDS
ncbi:MAG: cytochrome c maturation protein CcmE [Bacteroidota bacterium]